MAEETRKIESAWWVRAVAALPMPVLHALARVLALLAFRVFPYRPAVVRANLASAFPDCDAAALRRITRDY